MNRCVYRMQCRAQAGDRAIAAFGERREKFQSFIDNGEIMTVSVFRQGLDFFVYYECIDRIISPEELFGDFSELAEKWPGGEKPRIWIPMMDIYHCCEPVSEQYWRRMQPVRRVFVSINRLRPEMLASYIFYHFQYQEEKPGDWAKYAAIYLHENLMFFYHEDPDGPENPPYKGKLDTANTPSPWEPLMKQHFMPWDDDPEIKRPWREIETVFYL